MKSLTFFFDRTFGKRLPKALESMGPPVEIKYLQRVGFRADTPDDEWLSYAGQQGWIVLSEDRKWHDNAVETAAIVQNNVGAFYLPGAQRNRWFNLCFFVKRHQRLIRLAETTGRPFVYDVSLGGKIVRQDID
jgi:hypothetical protein